MKKTITLFTLISAVLALSSLNIKSQTPVATFKLNDVNSYFSAYFEPFARATAVSMGGGWYNTANTHKTLGFDISLISLSGAQIPQSDRLFPASKLTLTNGLSLDSQDDLPTIAASKDKTGPMLQQTIQSYPPQDMFQLFKGQGVGIGMAPNMFQVGIGLPKGIDIKIRYIPTFSIKPIKLDEVGLWGVGVQHDIKQWIPVVKKVPKLELSVLVAYSKFSAKYSGMPFPMTPEMFQATSSLPETTWDDQSLGFDVSSLVGNIIVGLKLPVINPYISFGFNSAKFDGGLRGSFPATKVQLNGTTLENVVDSTDIDPINIETKDFMMNMAVGFRLKLSVITLSAQYTLQKYSMVTAGFGISFR